MHQQPFHWKAISWIRIALLAGLATCMLGGCRAPTPLFGLASLSSFTSLQHPHQESTASLLVSIDQQTLDESLRVAFGLYEQGEKARLESDPQCVSYYAGAAMACWPQLNPAVANAADVPATGTRAKDQVAWDIYHESLRQMVASAMEHGELDPHRGIALTMPNGRTAYIQINRHDFPWGDDDFNEVQVLSEPVRSKLSRYWSDPGLGVPMVIVRRREAKENFIGKAIPFAATAVLRPSHGSGAQSIAMLTDATTSVSQVGYQPAGDPPTLAVLELHNPVRTTNVSYGNKQWELHRDTSAPLGLALNGFHHHKFKSFLLPGKADDDAGLRMIEPYQRGKIPIVFVHGLLSDRATWVDLLNDLHSSPWFNENYQVWFFQYQTGQPYVRSALEMRHALNQAVAFCDPEGTDPAMSEMVLVGHSMGGLVSKLQITHSGTELWDSIAVIPAEKIRTSEAKHQEIHELFFFEPLPYVKRVVFIGSPHQGSSLATSWIGVLGSALVHPTRERSRSIHKIVADNPGVFVKDITKHTPTSVDLLRPDNPLLMATYTLPVNPQVKLHTIIGNGQDLKDGTPADGVVPVASARHPGTTSEHLIDTTHTRLPDHEETTGHLVRILRAHSSDSDRKLELAGASNSSEFR